MTVCSLRLAHASRPRSRPLQLELKTGETYRGTLVEAEDNWNSQLKDIVVTGRVRRKGAARRASLGFFRPLPGPFGSTLPAFSCS